VVGVKRFRLLMGRTAHGELSVHTFSQLLLQAHHVSYSLAWVETARFSFSNVQQRDCGPRVVSVDDMACRNDSASGSATWHERVAWIGVVCNCASCYIGPDEFCSCLLAAVLLQHEPLAPGRLVLRTP
jgi:hypothetical protein